MRKENEKREGEKRRRKEKEKREGEKRRKKKIPSVRVEYTDECWSLITTMPLLETRKHQSM